MDVASNNSKGLPWLEWQCKKPIYADKISIKNLQISTDVFPDSFGRNKTQPALISVTLSLRQQFHSAAKEDALDESTINYGTLSKKILETIQRKTGTNELTTVQQLWSMTGDLIPFEVVEALEIDIFFPKACATADGIGFKSSMTREGYGSLVIYFKNIRTTALIGVNAHERESKQPVVVNVWLDDPKEEIQIPSHVRIVGKNIIQAIEESSFETLESLSTVVADGILKDLFVAEKKLEVGAGVKIAKPLAISFAEAPSVEIYKRPANN
ncbi:MAG: hypothetical protein M1822_006745 [Bathelium mastoideum]|nr:MAG: hypothetical protein M1822_006745 [Bathelium mastoideum]